MSVLGRTRAQLQAHEKSSGTTRDSISESRSYPCFGARSAGRAVRSVSYHFFWNQCTGISDMLVINKIYCAHNRLSSLKSFGSSGELCSLMPSSPTTASKHSNPQLVNARTSSVVSLAARLSSVMTQPPPPPPVILAARPCSIDSWTTRSHCGCPTPIALSRW